MSIPLLLTLGLHMSAAVFWLMSSLILGWNGHPGASKTMFRPQMAAAALAIFSGGGLWSMLHPQGFGRPEMALAAGAAIAIAAAGVQGGMVGGPVRRLAGAEPEGDVARRIVLGQRIATGMLAVVFLLMIGERYV